MKLNINGDITIKHLKHAELNIQIVTVFLNK